MQIASTMKHVPMYDMEGFDDGQCATHDGSCGTVSLPRATDDFRCDSYATEGCNRRNFDASPPIDLFASYYTAAFKQVAQRAKPAVCPP